MLPLPLDEQGVLFNHVKHSRGLLAIPAAYVHLACAGCWAGDAENTGKPALIAGEDELDPRFPPVLAHLESPHPLANVAPSLLQVVGH